MRTLTRTELIDMALMVSLLDDGSGSEEMKAILAQIKQATGKASVWAIGDRLSDGRNRESGQFEALRSAWLEVRHQLQRAAA